MEPGGIYFICGVEKRCGGCLDLCRPFYPCRSIPLLPLPILEVWSPGSRNGCVDPVVGGGCRRPRSIQSSLGTPSGPYALFFFFEWRSGAGEVVYGEEAFVGLCFEKRLRTVVPLLGGVVWDTWSGPLLVFPSVNAPWSTRFLWQMASPL